MDDCLHLRAPGLHGPYVKGRCPDCGRFVRGVYNRTTGYLDIRVVPEHQVSRVLSVARVILPSGREGTGIEFYSGRYGEVLVNVNGTLYTLDRVRVLERRPWRGDPEDPWIDCLV